ncbi:MAG TPA: ferritin [Anaerolineae bacterium]|nr:ferritin [Anaerolineae bacterium]HQK13484.1 ferritin [Anaerolineae bacterium]
MELSKNMENAINKQIQAENYSAYLYLAMAAYCDSVSMPGYAHWLREQCQEELKHAMKFYHYIVERGGRVILEAIQQPPVEFGSILSLAEEVYAHEQKVTSLIYALYELAVAEKDYATQTFLQWYINEQVEEEDNARTIAEKFKMAGGHPNILLMLDQQLGTRG